MAKSDKNTTRVPSRLKKLVNGIQSNMDTLYTSTYLNSPRNSKDLSNITSDINKSIDNIINNNMNTTGLPNISKLYSRLMDAQKDKKIIKDIREVFEDDSLMGSVMGSYMQNKYLKDLDYEIDTVCKYMPELLEALETRKDNVLSADHFSKDFINVTNDMNTSNMTIFADRIESIKDRYDLQNLLEDIYDNASKYGEQFVYIVPYKKALAKLLANKTNTMMGVVQTESGQILTEGQDPFIMSEGYKDLFKDKNYEIKMELNMSNVIESAVKSYRLAEQKMRMVNEAAVNNYEADSKSIGKSDRFTHTISDDLEFDKIKDDTTGASDGLVTKDDIKKLEKQLTVPGCIVKRIDRASVIPIYIEDMCLGYYYFEFAEHDETFDFNGSIADPFASMKSNSKVSAEAEDSQRNQMLRFISGQISQYIDAKFINNNQDLRKEIYMMLKHNDVFNTPTNDKFRVTYIPPEDMIHVYFRKDPKTHRGISDLEKALFPAKLYSTLYITNTIAAMTRGQDKRVYYVRQTVDTNISKLLLNTINQIKKSNFGIRQIENINHVLNITGRLTK